MTEHLIQLPNDRYVLRWIYEDVLAQLQVALPKLQHGRSYSLEKIYQPERWLALHPDERKIAGKILASLVAANSVPLIFVGRSSSNAALYQLN